MRINFKQVRRRHGQAGVTLLEALVSMGIFGVSFFSLYAGMSMGFAVIGNARENLRATQIMVEKMETIRLYSWDQINTAGFIPATFTDYYYPTGTSGGYNSQDGGGGTTGGTTQVTSSYGEETDGGDSQPARGVVYTGRVVIGNGPSGHTYSTDMRRVSISVNWTSGGRTHTRTMVTYVSRHGLQNYIY